MEVTMTYGAVSLDGPAPASGERLAAILMRKLLDAADSDDELGEIFERNPEAALRMALAGAGLRLEEPPVSVPCVQTPWPVQDLVTYKFPDWTTTSFDATVAEVE